MTCRFQALAWSILANSHWEAKINHNHPLTAAGDHDTAVTVAALAALGRLAQQNNHSRNAVRLAGGIPLIIRILADCSSRLLVAGEAAACLGAVAIDNLENQVGQLA